MRLFVWLRDKYWDFREWWFFRKSPIHIYPAFEPCTTEIEGIKLVNVHNPAKCEGRTCIVHSPTDHHMRGWTLHWRDDRGIFERLCPMHGVGHPDPDQYDYWDSVGQSYQAIHGCCGCCQLPRAHE